MYSSLYPNQPTQNKLRLSPYGSPMEIKLPQIQSSAYLDLPKINNTMGPFTKRHASVHHRGNTEVPSMFRSMGQGLSGSKAQIHDKYPGLTTNASLHSPSGLGLDDMVNSTLNRPKFGFNFYKSPSNDMLMKKVRNGPADKSKNPDFHEQVKKKNGWVPGADRYDLTTDWTKALPKNNGKFKKQEKITATEAIFKDQLKYNKPSCASYNDPWKQQSGHPKTIGNYKQQDIAINFMQEAENDSMRIPGSNRYNSINLDIINDRTLKARIYKTNFPRFKALEKNHNPGPTSYNNAESITYSSTMMKSSKYTIKKEEKKFIQDLRVKEIYSSSPASYKVDGTTYNNVARVSPRQTKKRQ